MHCNVVVDHLVDSRDGFSAGPQPSKAKQQTQGNRAKGGAKGAGEQRFCMGEIRDRHVNKLETRLAVKYLEVGGCRLQACPDHSSAIVRVKLAFCGGWSFGRKRGVEPCGSLRER